jgi:hypothetical protein
MAVKKVAARWREFGAAAFMALTFILMGAPPLPMLAAIGLVGLWNLYAYRREQGTLPRK